MRSILANISPGLPSVWIEGSSRIGQLKPDISMPGYMEYVDREWTMGRGSPE